MTAPEAEAVVTREPSAMRTFWASIAAVAGKESRWRMRGRRAFVVVTIYVALMSLLVYAMYRIVYDSALQRAQFMSEGFGFPSEFVSGSVSAEIGQAIFGAILVLQTVLTVMVAPALTAGAISAEREKQTFELLITTPVSTLGLVVGKLISSLAFLFLLIAASVPLMSVVFAFGGLAPEDMVRAYVLLTALAFGIGSIGLFMSALIKRTQIATVLSYIIVLILMFGTLALHTYLMASTREFEGNGFARTARHHAPVALLWLNPLAADVDAVCTATPESYQFTCSYIALVTGRDFAGAGPIRPGQFQQFDTPRDALWPLSTASFLILGVGLTLLATQLIAPSRRIRRQKPPALPPDPRFDVGAIDPVPTERVSPGPA
jgi:ABC-type transport system involved in multi-copper enzyme maturation permease subunit